MAGPYDGRTAVNKTTGERIVLKDGQWVPMAQDGVGMPALDADAQAAIKDSRNAASASQQLAQTVPRFDKLNRETPTGPIFGDVKLPIPFTDDSSVSINPIRALAMSGAFDKLSPHMGRNLQEMEGYTALGIPGRHTTTGPMTDADARMYQRTLQSIGTWGSANTDMGEQIKAFAKSNADYSAFLEDFARRNGGRVSGAREKWMEYQNANPIFTADGEINRKRADWRAHLYGAATSKGGQKRLRYNPKTGELE